jgi:hypothetical protein
VLASWHSDRAFAEQRLSGVHPNWLKRVAGGVPEPFDVATVAATLKQRFGAEGVAEALANMFV